MIRGVWTRFAAWAAAVRGRFRVRERGAAIIVAVALVIGPASMIAYGRWVDRGVVTVKAVQWAYFPKTVYAKAGVPVRLKIISEDVVHGFAINGIPVTISELIPGKAEYVTFTLTTPGTYYYRCTTYCGLSHFQMVGQIIVAAGR
jgi:heme/copper-type cytochrome/quinol oxidase subunit 2